MSDPHASAAAAVEDEPRTPGWLPALGAALFIAAGLWWAVTPAKVAATGASAPTSPASAAPPPAPTPPAATALPAMPVNPQRQPMPMPSTLPPSLQQQIQNIRNHPHP